MRVIILNCQNIYQIFDRTLSLKKVLKISKETSLQINELDKDGKNLSECHELLFYPKV